MDVQSVVRREQLSRLEDTLPGERWLIQECVRGRLGAICGVAWKGAIVSAVHQIAHRIWPVDVGVSAYAETVAPDHALEQGVARLVSELGWSGIFQAQFIHADDGPFLIDFNPRIYGSLALATAAGANLPAIWVALVTGAPFEPRSYRLGVRYRSDELDARALLHLLLSGRPATASRGLIPRRHTVHSVLSVHDPAPALTTLAKIGRRLSPIAIVSSRAAGRSRRS
jgi:predicted ATP-grasp superfamily ATP-dependent carboligase